MKPWIVFLIGCVFSLAGPMICHAEPDYEKLATAILHAEGNSNYGILTHYKHTSYRQACINTCKHAWKDYSASVGTWPRNGSNASEMAYLAYLANRYCPVGALNDPTGLNKNWLTNVRFYYDQKRRSG